MNRSPFTFAGALSLVDPERSASAVFDRLLGGALFAGAATVAIAGGPATAAAVGAAAAGLSGTDVLGLVDPKNEATRLLAPLVDGAVERLRGTSGHTRQELAAAAHTVTVLSSFFDALREQLGPVYGKLELTEAERRRLAGLPDPPAGRRGFVRELLDTQIALPSARCGLAENLEEHLRPYFRRLVERCLAMFEGLSAWKGGDAGLADRVVDGATARYQDRMLRLGVAPPFALWLVLNEHTATRAATREALGELRELLAVAARGTAPPRKSHREQLARAARAVLDEPLLRSGSRAMASPTVGRGFVEPAFQLAAAGPDVSAADEHWWADRPVQQGLVSFLAAYLAGPDSLDLPLVLLGHPGAGKSLLTEVLAAQLPAESFAVVRVPLRRVNTDDDLVMQITKELRRTLQRPQADLDDLRAECDAGPGQCRMVVLLDGFDELVQATGVTQSGYFTKIAAFQKRARMLGAPVAVIVTSRTVVADRAELPETTPLLKLCEFDGDRIAAWIAAWNEAHAGHGDFRPLSSAGLAGSASVAELARQPLLLLMLAVYLAETHASGFVGEQLSQSELYRRILDRFIERQTVEKRDDPLPGPAARKVQRRLRRQLQYTAFGMFNRGRQFITDDELDADLRALSPAERTANEVETLREAHRVLSEFLFVHNARADRERLGTYEFLHATFAEYLVAELVVQQLRLLAQHRAVEADEPGLDQPRLSDDLLRALLSHEPISARRPILTFVQESVAELTIDDRKAFLDTAAELARAARVQPDAPTDRYAPVPVNPIRRRAAYLANLVLLRFTTTDEPAPFDTVVDDAPPGARDNWRQVVLLWRAGLDEAGWESVVGTLAESGLAGARERLDGIDVRGPDVDEAALLDDRALFAAAVVGRRLVNRYHEDWTKEDLSGLVELLKIYNARTGVPGLRGVLPSDLQWYQALADHTASQRVNESVAHKIGVLLSRDAGQLPKTVVKSLVQTALENGYRSTAELAAVPAAHPTLLTEVPQLRAVLAEPDMSTGLTAVAVLWRAEGATSGDDRAVLRELRNSIDEVLAATTLVGLSSAWFAPDFVTYLGVERPERWRGHPNLLGRLATLGPAVIGSIDPVDAAFACTFVGGPSAPRFASEYLKARGDIRQSDRQEDEEAIDVLRGRAEGLR